jgi:ribosomal protein S18 acetylase RimI-like enzyme
MNITIRSVSSSEYAGWKVLFQGYADFYSAVLSPGSQEQVWEWIFDSQQQFWCDVAVADDGSLVGFVQYQLMHRSLSGGMVCYLSDLFVLPSCRKTGTGKDLIDHVFLVARENQWPNVRWLTQENNERARKLYDHYASRSEFILYSVPVS